MRPAIEVRDLNYSYRDGKAALRGVTFSIGHGECVGLIGPNGAGKTTLLFHLNGILPEEMGDGWGVYVDGEQITAKSLPGVRRKVGLLFEDPDDQLFCPTVFEDVAFGPEQLGLDAAGVRRVVEESLARVGLQGFGDRSPHHLSSGEKRRVCLAGVLACSPSILALDEPSSDLDPRGRRELMGFLKTIPAAKLIATHDLELVVELCPRVIVLDEGRIIADGKTRTVLSNEALMIAHGLEKPHILRHRHPHR